MFSIVVQLQALRHHDLRLGSRLVHSGAVPAGAVSVVSLADRPRSRMAGTFEAMQFYVPEALLDELSQEDGLPRASGLRWPRAQPDPVAASIAALLLPAFAVPNPAATMYVEHLALAFLSHAVTRYGNGQPRPSLPRGGLAGWQERRAKELMRASLHTALTITDVSRACNLSPSYFAAAFRRTTGRTPHRYFSEMRVHEALRLLRSSEKSLSEIAFHCGFGDQSHFTRVFSTIMGESPGAWRRVHGYAGRDPARPAQDEYELQP